MNSYMTSLAIQGYVERQKAEGAHPSTPIAIPFTLAEWEALLKRPQEEERDAIIEECATICDDVAAIVSEQIDSTFNSEYLRGCRNEARSLAAAIRALKGCPYTRSLTTRPTASAS